MAKTQQVVDQCANERTEKAPCDILFVVARNPVVLERQVWTSVDEGYRH